MKKFKIFLARRGGASRPARPARFARLSFGICQVKVVHFFGTSVFTPVRTHTPVSRYYSSPPRVTCMSKTSGATGVVVAGAWPVRFIPRSRRSFRFPSPMAMRPAAVVRFSTRVAPGTFEVTRSPSPLELQLTPPARVECTSLRTSARMDASRRAAASCRHRRHESALALVS